MVLNLFISPQAEAALRQRAVAAGVDVETYAQRQLELFASASPELRTISGPIGEAFADGGMSEEDLGEFLETEKHAARAERRAKEQ